MSKFVQDEQNTTLNNDLHNSNHCVPGPCQAALSLGNEAWFWGNHLIDQYTLRQFCDVQHWPNIKYLCMRTQKFFVHGPKNACCMFGLPCSHVSPWQ